MKMREKMIKKLCQYIYWYTEVKEESYYHFFTGYLEALRDLGMDIQVIRDVFVVCDGKTYKVEDYK